MTKSQFSDWDTTAANNSDINDIPLAESQMRVHHTNNAIREVMAQLRTSIEPGAQVNNFAGSTGSTDNALLRADGTGGATLQASSVTVDDSGNMSGVGTLGVGAITTTGLLTVDGQIKFPATQNASSDANTLDDYEEGTWTPGISFNGGTTGITYSVQNGQYIKIGQFVSAFFSDIRLTSKGSDTGTARVTGLPFTQAGGGFGTCKYYTGLSSISTIIFNCQAGQTYVLVSAFGAVNIQSVTDSNFTDTSFIVGALCYNATA